MAQEQQVVRTRESRGAGSDDGNACVGTWGAQRGVGGEANETGHRSRVVRTGARAIGHGQARRLQSGSMRLERRDAYGRTPVSPPARCFARRMAAVTARAREWIDRARGLPCGGTVAAHEGAGERGYVDAERTPGTVGARRERTERGLCEGQGVAFRLNGHCAAVMFERLAQDGTSVCLIWA